MKTTNIMYSFSNLEFWGYYIQFIFMMFFLCETNQLWILGSVDFLNMSCSFGHFDPKMNLFWILSNEMLEMAQISFHSVSILMSYWQVIGIPSFWLETLVIISVEFNPSYPIIYAWIWNFYVHFRFITII